MKNITLRVPENTYRKARIYAAEQDTSISSLVARHLEKLTSKQSETESALIRRARDLQTLWDLAEEPSSTGETSSLGPFIRDDMHERGFRG